MADPSQSTLYPKITTHIPEVIKTLKWQERSPENPAEDLHLEPIPIVGTVKLHGTHADILVYNDDALVFQSRNNANLTTTADNFDFASSMIRRKSIILWLRDQYIARWKRLNSDVALDTSIPITIAGEWVGDKIQKGVAVANLSKSFVIISAKIDGKWVPDSEYADIEAPHDEIYNISRGGMFQAILYPEDLQRTMNELECLAEKVAARCPFAESFGIIGEGEGLVWKPLPYISDPQLWFKTKGGRFKPTFTPAQRKIPDAQVEQRRAAETLAKAWCSKLRSEQGWDYLREMRIERNMKGIGPFLKWVQQDILVEEAGYIEENKVDAGLLRMEIVAVAKPWYLRRCGLVYS